MGKGFAKTREETLSRNADATCTVEFGLDKAGENDIFTALAVLMGQHGEGNGHVTFLPSSRPCGD